jgi:RHS repeat-associated protein
LLSGPSENSSVAKRHRAVGRDFREYNPEPGRWLTPDPLAGEITNPQSLNRYTYVLNQPTTLTDPSGLDCEQEMNLTTNQGGIITFYPTQTTWVDCYDWTNWADLAFVVGGASQRGGGGGGAGSSSLVPPKPNIIRWPQLQQLVHENNESTFCDELIDCIIFKESALDGGFNAEALGVPFKYRGTLQQAKGLMQVTQGAAQTVSKEYTSYPPGLTLYEELSDPAINIQVGSDYLQYLYGKYGNNLRSALNHYGGTVKSGTYADDILECLKQLQRGNVPAAEAAAHGNY